jgi:sugar-specific transcriptional regulator TrmB
MQEPRTHLLSLGLSDSEVTTYLAMISGARTARDLGKVTQLKRPTVYYALSCLEKRGLVSKSGLEGDKRFSLEPLERLTTIAEEKARESVKLNENIQALIATLATDNSSVNQRPLVSFFEGVEAVQHVIMEILYCHNKEIYSVVPNHNFFWQIGPDFVQTYIEERKSRAIKTKNLWEKPIDSQLIQQYYKGFSEVRILPSVMKGKFATTVFLYDDKTLYISSMQNAYCVLIRSQEHHDTMRAWFDGLWSSSKPHA